MEADASLHVDLAQRVGQHVVQLAGDAHPFRLYLTEFALGHAPRDLVIPLASRADRLADPEHQKEAEGDSGDPRRGQAQMEKDRDGDGDDAGGGHRDPGPGPCAAHGGRNDRKRERDIRRVIRVAEQQQVCGAGGRDDRHDRTGKAAGSDEGARPDECDPEAEKERPDVAPLCRVRDADARPITDENARNLHQERDDDRDPQRCPAGHAPWRAMGCGSFLPGLLPSGVPARAGVTTLGWHGSIVLWAMLRGIRSGAAERYSFGSTGLNERKPQGVEPRAAIELPDLDSNQEPAG